MTRSLLAGLFTAVAVTVISGTGCQSTGVGDPCTPEAEYDSSFLGFDEGEVSVEAKSFQCQTRLCLVNHFRGRVSCPYGQNADGSNKMNTQPCNQAAINEATANNNPAPAPAGCCTPGINQPVDGMVNGQYANMTLQATVAPQCSGRTAADAVYCSCRCANINGQTNDGYNYCTCPSGFSCTQIVNSLGGNANQGLTGAYCVKNNTVYNPNEGCSDCDPATANCGNAQGVSAGH